MTNDYDKRLRLLEDKARKLDTQIAALILVLLIYGGLGFVLNWLFR